MSLLERWFRFTEERKLWKQRDWILPIGPGWEEVLVEQLRSNISVRKKIGWILFIWTQFMPMVGEFTGIQAELELRKQSRKSEDYWLLQHICNALRCMEK